MKARRLILIMALLLQLIISAQEDPEKKPGQLDRSNEQTTVERKLVLIPSGRIQNLGIF